MKSSRLRKIIIAGALGALSVVMAVSPIGYLPWFGGVSITIMHIPVILAGILEGPIAGGIVGLVFGVTSLIKAAVAPIGPLDPLFTNPFVSVLPRLFIGLIAWLVYQLFRGKLKFIAAALAGAIGGFANTVLVLSALGFFEGKTLARILEIDIKLVFSVLSGIAVSNGLLEAAIAAVLTGAIISVWTGIGASRKAKLAKEE